MVHENRDRRLGLLIVVVYSLAGIVAACATLRPAHAQEITYTAADTLAAIAESAAEIGVSEAWLTAAVSCETGRTFDPYSVGRQGELGPAQLAPWGELRRFYAWGYSDPFDPYQSIRFMAQRFSQGGARAWSCA